MTFHTMISPNSDYADAPCNEANYDAQIRIHEFKKTAAQRLHAEFLRMAEAADVIEWLDASYFEADVISDMIADAFCDGERRLEMEEMGY